MQVIRLITWNLHGLPAPARSNSAAKLHAAASEACRRKPDVIFFQEVWLESYAVEVARVCAGAGYSAVLPGLGGRMLGGLLTFYDSRAWSEESREFIEYRDHAPAWRLWEADGISHKGLLRVHLKHRQTAFDASFVNTHLQAEYAAARPYAAIRARQLAQFTEVVARDAPVVAGGDLNTEPDEDAYRTLPKDWIDLTAAFRRECNRCGTFLETPGKTRPWFDYVFLKKDPAWNAAAKIELIRNRAADEPFSDHDGVQADITISRPSAAFFGAQMRRRGALHMLARQLRNGLGYILTERS